MTGDICRDEEDACLGQVRWLGRLPDMYGQQLVAGVFLVSIARLDNNVFCVCVCECVF